MNKLAYGLLFFFFIAFSNVRADVSPETVVDIFQRLEDLEKKTRQLHGKNEELQHQITLLKKQQKQGFLAVDERIDQIKSVKKTDSSKVEQEPKVKIVDPSPKSTPVEKEAKPKKQEAAKTDKVVDKPKITAQKPEQKKSRAPTSYEKETYQAAFNMMKKSPSAATRSFQEYIKMQPSSPLAPNAQYWIGEIMYSHNNYKGAVQEFIKVLQKYKYSDKAPDAAIKLGYSFYALKNWKFARRTFEDVLKFFPKNTNAVNLAKKRLEKMKAAGH